MTLLAIAHRAGNSLAGLHAALELGADVIEADVHSYRGRLEVRHLKTMGPLPFLWDRWELVPAAAPRLGLAELLAAARQGTPFLLDLKGRDVGAGAHVARHLHEHAPGQPVLVCSRFWPALDSFQGLSWVRDVLSARNRIELSRLLARIRTGRPPYGVSVHRSLLDATVVEQLRNRVELVMSWPINDEQALATVVGIGVNGVISDETHILEQVRAQRDVRESGSDGVAQAP